MIELTKQMSVSNAAHILYFFDNTDTYLENLMAYIKAGIERNNHIVIIENPTILPDLQQRVKNYFSKEKQNCIHYVNNYSFYQCYGDFQTRKILEHFNHILEPYFHKNLNVRTWAHVEWNDQQHGISTKLEKHEKIADFSVNKMGLMSVCAYASSKVSASLQTAMMKSHEYLMTDKEFVRSPLY